MPLSSGFHGQNNAGNPTGTKKPKPKPALKKNPPKSAADPQGPTIVKEHYGNNSSSQPTKKVVTVQSKCGTLDNVNHKPGGGKNKIFDQPTVYKSNQSTKSAKSRK
ncbi:uncharacterized protein LOC142350791 [Convolutriloba macropyga]|uniref:uncharacterized protein LOC142350791 n=1 Tax=Convolutriloba macropyga TaxID=536237 RepID=UPI003F5226EC